VADVDPDRELAELRTYLGDAFDEAVLVDSVRALERELEAAGDEETLYRSSEVYLYDLTAFAMTNTKAPYRELLRDALPPPARLLDYGCGIGSDGLALLEAGYDVSFADFDNPSTRYLRWRLEHRGLRADVHDLDAGPPPGGYDCAYAFDVAEHVPDPVALLEAMEAQAGAVLVNFLDPEPGETTLHHQLPVADLLARSARRGLRRYARLHGRSHVVLYDRERAAGWGRLRARATLWRGRLARPWRGPPPTPGVRGARRSTACPRR
jgi:hypothetical protein